jgi:CubicO group peptidase (beta-lactamase class C family)
MSDDRQFPEGAWPESSPAELGFDEEKLQLAADWLDHNALSPYRVGILRNGHLLAVWRKGVELDAKRGIGSGHKTLYGCMLAIAIDEGKIGSADDCVVDYFPEIMDVPEGKGPKAGRFAREKDRGITFRQLITNTSGYLKPDERPGEKFHYQTFGMNVLTHAIEKVYDCYDPTGSTNPPGFGSLVQEKIGDPIGAKIASSVWNFPYLPPDASTEVFGNGVGLACDLDGWLRIAYLWMNMGNWKGKQIIPGQWLEEGTRTAELVKACTSEEDWCYGYAFWTNDYDKRWPGLPRDSFFASGAGYNFVWVCPSLDLIIVQNPGGGAYLKVVPDPDLRALIPQDMHLRERKLLKQIVDSCI